MVTMPMVVGLMLPLQILVVVVVIVVVMRMVVVKKKIVVVVMTTRLFQRAAGRLGKRTSRRLSQFNNAHVYVAYSTILFSKMNDSFRSRVY